MGSVQTEALLRKKYELIRALDCAGDSVKKNQLTKQLVKVEEWIEEAKKNSDCGKKMINQEPVSGLRVNGGTENPVFDFQSAREISGRI
ncbi:MAG: hypothetical protein CVV21_11255 [Candidatus Goldiibacteriota bacterium HGW-Goldbacteria-1]|jgi:hypothetical protein|nr:MAG: hypothetical protein CVV21_11255 [Candidatus Goldiibacteriota bacterium HGW-Goldbacteria-1]